VRLTKRMASGRTYEPYTVVKAGDYDLIGDKDLRDPVAPYGYGLVTPIWELLGYIDSDCSGDWTCPDKLYLQQITGTIADDVVTIGDLRLYIPPEEIQPDDNDDFDPMVYDTDLSGEIDKSEVFAAIADYFDNNSISRLLKAFEDGADGVYVASCLEDTCHNVKGSQVALNRVNYVKNVLSQLNLDPSRIEMYMISRESNQGFIDAAKDMTERIKILGTSRLKGK
jgi:coenzyme F420-reducing hydrogenase delta subunit